MKKPTKKTKKGEAATTPPDPSQEASPLADLSPADIADLDKLLNSVFAKHLGKVADADIAASKAAEAAALNKEYKENMEHLLPMLSEYLNNFVVIGHDIIGNEVSFMYAKNQNDKNAVYKLLGDTFMKMIAANHQ